jgi:hypothetical protein
MNPGFSAHPYPTKLVRGPAAETMNLTDLDVFHYQPCCFVKGCPQPAIYKVAAPWSDGTASELKNYGLACEEHRSSLVERAQTTRAALKLADGETVGPIAVYPLRPGFRDSELEPLLAELQDRLPPNEPS